MKTVSARSSNQMTYIVSSGALNSTHSLTLPIYNFSKFVPTSITLCAMDLLINKTVLFIVNVTINRLCLSVIVCLSLLV